MFDTAGIHIIPTQICVGFLLKRGSRKMKPRIAITFFGKRSSRVVVAAIRMDAKTYRLRRGGFSSFGRAPLCGSGGSGIVARNPPQKLKSPAKRFLLL